jgi:lysine-N-methylase
VPIDRAAYEKYQNLTASPLRTLIVENIAESVEGATKGTGSGEIARAGNAVNFAQIRMNSANRCPLFTSERLCRIHAELGEGMLGYACSTYPRIVHEIGGVRETALALSCPEAARLVLLNPDLLRPELLNAGLPGTELPSPQRTAMEQVVAAPGNSHAEEGARALPADFLEIRRAMLALVGMRSYPLWQRMFLLGLLCRRLDSIALGELKRSVTEFLADFKAAVDAGSLLPAMETLPVDRSAQLDVVLRLAGMLLHRSNVSPRFAECVQAFTTGIGNGPGATLDSLTRQYTVAHDHSYEPFFRHHPHILENYLVNTIIRCQFPFGREGMEVGAEPRRTQEFAKLTAQFALIRGLLIGVAGFHGMAFSTAHVVSTVQSAAKHFEHHPGFLKLAYELLLESQMDGARGTAILLRNAGQEITTAVLPDVRVPRPRVYGPEAQPEA